MYQVTYSSIVGHFVSIFWLSQQSFTVFVWTYDSVPLKNVVELLGISALCSKFWETAKLFSKSPFYVPTSNVRGLPFLHTLVALVIIWLIGSSHPWWWYLTVASFSISLVTSDVGHLSICFLAICVSSLEECWHPLPGFKLG